MNNNKIEEFIQNMEVVENPKKYIDPRREKEIEKTKKKYRKEYFYRKEKAKVRKKLNKTFRKRIKRLDHDLTVTNHDWKTGGWVSW